MADIVVIGSINMDVVVLTDKIPQGGETLRGRDFNLIAGGKGANQAVAASRSGVSTAMIGCVGTDAFGAVLVQTLAGSAVDVTGISKIEGTPSGTATILVECGGENRIIIVGGANDAVNGKVLEANRTCINQAKLMMLQFEVPMPTVAEALQIAKHQGLKTVLNPAPAYPVGDDLLACVDYLILNETETQVLSGVTVTQLDDAACAAKILLARGVGCVIITLGARGACLQTPTLSLHQTAFKVNVLDTTAAGDTFAGAFAASICNNQPLAAALRFAVAASAIAVTRLGAQPSIPTADEINQFLLMHSHQEVLPNVSD